MHQVQLGPHFSDKPLNQDPNRLEEHHKTLDPRCARARPTGLGEAGRARKHVENAEQLTTDSRGRSKPSREGRRLVATSPGWLADGRPASPTWQPLEPPMVWKLSITTLPAYNRRHLLNRPRSTINRAHSPTCNTHYPLERSVHFWILFIE